MQIGLIPTHRKLIRSRDHGGAIEVHWFVYSRLQKFCNTQAEQWKTTIMFEPREGILRGEK